MGTKYGVKIECDAGKNYVAIQKEIEKVLDEYNVHKEVSDICKSNNIAKCKITIDIFIPPNQIPL